MQWSKRFGLPTSADVKALGVAIADLRQRDPRAEIATALFVPQADICLPVRDVDKPEDTRQHLQGLLLRHGRKHGQGTALSLSQTQSD
jgi:hypothetical protein